MKVDAIEQVHRTDTTGSLSLLCQIDGEQQQMVFPAQVSQALLLALLSMPPPKSGSEIVQSPIRIRGMNTFRLSNGLKALGLHLANGYVLPIEAPEQTSRHLRTLADELDQMP